MTWASGGDVTFDFSTPRAWSTDAPHRLPPPHQAARPPKPPELLPPPPWPWSRPCCQLYLEDRSQARTPETMRPPFAHLVVSSACARHHHHASAALGRMQANATDRYAWSARSMVLPRPRDPVSAYLMVLPTCAHRRHASAHAVLGGLQANTTPLCNVRSFEGLTRTLEIMHPPLIA